jgi:nitrogen fixation protein FixH
VASDPDGDQVAIDLYYDTDTQPNEKQLIAADLENSGEYEWDTSGIAEGDYHLMGVATDSSSQEETDYTSETLRIEHNDLPEIIINTPSSQGDIADDSYVIRWEATDPDSDELAIELLYSMTENLDDAVTIETDLVNNGEYEWDTSQIGDGEWFVCGTASDGILRSEDCSDYTLEINHTQPNNAPEIFIYSPAPFRLIDDGVDVQWSVADADGDLLEIDILFRHSSNTELATISSGLAPSGSLFWDTSALDEGDYYLAISASDGRATTWRNVSVSIVHPEFSVILASIQVIPPDLSEGDNVVFFVIVSSAGGLDGIAELTWSVDGEAASTALVDLVAGTDSFSQFDWIATSGDHTITVSAGEASQSVMVSVSSAPEVEVEEGLNPWIYSIPITAAVGGIAILLRRMRGSGGDDQDEFEWE